MSMKVNTPNLITDEEDGAVEENLPPGFPPYPTYKTIIPPPESTTVSFSNYRQSNKRHNVLCANCGYMGHIYKNCNHPIISYGIICYRLVFNSKLNGICPEYLMVQRKDSLSYVEFIRGKYNIKAKTYIMDMFALMTEDERVGIQQNTFERLWQTLWCKNISDDNKSFSKEYKEACDKFNMLKSGYFIKSGDEMTLFSIDYIIENTTSRYNETEWGFPKGRRNINECDIHCAIREFKEETGIHSKSIFISTFIKPLEEVFSGSNNIRYKHVYYVAKMLDNNSISVDPSNKQQCKEIRNINWFNYTEAQSKIRDTNIERKELFRRLNQTIMKNIK